MIYTSHVSIMNTLPVQILPGVIQRQRYKNKNSFEQWVNNCNSNGFVILVDLNDIPLYYSGKKFPQLVFIVLVLSSVAKIIFCCTVALLVRDYTRTVGFFSMIHIYCTFFYLRKNFIINSYVFMLWFFLFVMWNMKIDTDVVCDSSVHEFVFLWFSFRRINSVLRDNSSILYSK